MAKAALEASAGVAGFLRERRQRLGLTLRDVESQTRGLGRPIPFSTLAKVEKGAFDPGLKRLHLLFRLYGLEFEVAAQLLDLEEFSGDWPDVVGDPKAAYDEGVRRWKTGDTRGGLAALLALRAHVPADGAERAERQKWLHTLSVFVGSLGRYRLSRQIVEELLLEPPAPGLVVPVLVQAAVCWHWLGSGDAALAFLLQAENHIGSDDHQERAWVFHERTSTLASMGRFGDAEAALEVTLREYEAAGDEHGVSRAMGSRVRLATEQGRWPAALDVARAAREHAEQRGFARLVTMRTIDVGRILTELGDAPAGLAALNEALQRAVAASDDVGRFFVHYYLARAHAAAGETERAAVERRNAEYYVRFVDAKAPEALDVRGASGQVATSAPRAARVRGRGTGRRSR